MKGHFLSDEQAMFANDEVELYTLMKIVFLYPLRQQISTQNIIVNNVNYCTNNRI